MRIQTLVDTNGPATFVQSISLSVGQEVCFLGRPVGDFGVSNDDRMTSMADAWCWQRSTDIMPQKSDFKKITRAKYRETRKRTAKTALLAEIRRPGFPGSPTTMGPVTVGHGRRRPWGFCPFFGRRFLAVSRAFSLLFSLVFFFEISLHLLAWFHWRKLVKKSCKSGHKVSYFCRSRRLCSRFSANSWN